MARVRGDDELLEILDMMAGEGEYHQEEDEENKEISCSSTNSTTEHRDGGENGSAFEPSSPSENVVCVPETGWNATIWNPHIVENTSPATVVATSLPQSSHFAGADGGGGSQLGPRQWGRETEGVGMRLVSPHEEVLRQQAVAVVFSRFQVLCKELGIRAKNEMFERWQFSRKLKEGTGGDPILPAKAFFCPGLSAELTELGVPNAQARNLCCELGRASKAALKTLSKQLRVVRGAEGSSSSSTSSSGRGVTAKRSDETTFVLQLGKNRLRVNSAHYLKMKELFRRTRVDIIATRSNASARGNGVVRSLTTATTTTMLKSDRECKWLENFHDCLFACLMRYEALQGGGFQAAAGGDAFDVLLKHFNVRMECFASPFNCRYGSYCSAFRDTDAPFGSVGSFFDFRPTEGAFEANPPFVRDVILKMANHMNHLLKATSKELTFVVMIPAWEDATGWKRLQDSVFLSKHVKIDQKDHGYCEGKQHLRRNRYRVASFHTSVFFLQTPAAARAAPVTDEACDELRRAFTPRSEEEEKVQKVDGGNGEEGSGSGGGDDDGDGGNGRHDLAFGNEQALRSSASAIVPSGPPAASVNGKKQKVIKKNKRAGSNDVAAIVLRGGNVGTKGDDSAPGRVGRKQGDAGRSKAAETEELDDGSTSERSKNSTRSESDTIVTRCVETGMANTTESEEQVGGSVIPQGVEGMRRRDGSAAVESRKNLKKQKNINNNRNNTKETQETKDKPSNGTPSGNGVQDGEEERTGRRQAGMTAMQRGGGEREAGFIGRTEASSVVPFEAALLGRWEDGDDESSSLPMNVQGRSTGGVVVPVTKAAAAEAAGDEERKSGKRKKKTSKSGKVGIYGKDGGGSDGDVRGASGTNNGRARPQQLHGEDGGVLKVKVSAKKRRKMWRDSSELLGGAKR